MSGCRIEVKSGELPKNVVTLHASYKKLQRRGRTAEAAACLHRLRELAPDNGFVCHSLGLASQQEGRVDEAQVHFERGTACKGAASRLAHGIRTCISLLLASSLRLFKAITQCRMSAALRA